MGGREPGWLAKLKCDLAEITSAEALKIWPGSAPGMPPYYNYRLEHARQVEKLALLLHAGAGGDRDVILAAVWAHDRFKPQFEGENHAGLAAEWVLDNLAGYGFPSRKVGSVSFAVRHHVGFTPPVDEVGPDKVEARILFDADKLDKFGLHAFVYRLMAHAAYPAVPLTLESAAEPGRSLPSAAEIRKRFFFEQSAEIAIRNLKFQRKFYADLKKELL